MIKLPKCSAMGSCGVTFAAVVLSVRNCEHNRVANYSLVMRGIGSSYCVSTEAPRQFYGDGYLIR